MYFHQYIVYPICIPNNMQWVNVHVKSYKYKTTIEMTFAGINHAMLLIHVYVRLLILERIVCIKLDVQQ